MRVNAGIDSPLCGPAESDGVSPAGRTLRVLGVRVDLVQIRDALALIQRWIDSDRKKGHQVVVTGMHGLMEAHKDPGFKAVLNASDLFIPDGISLIWLARLQGFPLEKRACGTDLIREFCTLASRKGYKSFFYGDTEDTLQQLAARLKAEFPGLKIAGLHAPPFHPLTPEEDAEAVRRINEAGPDVLWVGLGCPKQERWIFEHRDKLKVPVTIGVGAAFRFVSGSVKRAPAWVGDHGLEWLWRFTHEPRKVWRRVLVDGPRFLSLVALELSGMKKFD